jgi:hypothetical protein
VVEIKANAERQRSAADDRSQPRAVGRADDHKAEDRQFREQQVDKYLRKNSK